MSVRIIQGNCLDVLPMLAAEGVRAHGLGRTFLLLESSLHRAVTGFAQRHQIGQRIGFSVVGKQSVGTDMMHVLSRSLASLAGAGVSFPSSAFLCCPVRATVAVTATKVLRVLVPNAVRISAGAGAVFSFAAARVRHGSFEYSAAADAGQGELQLRSSFPRRILTRSRAMFAATVLQPAWDAAETNSAMGTDKLNLRDGRDICGRSSNVAHITANKRAVFGFVASVWTDLKVISANLASYHNHCEAV